MPRIFKRPVQGGDDGRLENLRGPVRGGHNGRRWSGDAKAPPLPVGVVRRQPRLLARVAVQAQEQRGVGGVSDLGPLAVGDNLIFGGFSDHHGGSLRPEQRGQPLADHPVDMPLGELAVAAGRALARF